MGEDSNLGTIIDLQVPQDSDFEDEYVMIYCNDASDKPIMCNLKDLDSQGSAFFATFTPGDLSNSRDFVNAVLALCPIEKPYSAVSRGLAQLNEYCGWDDIPSSTPEDSKRRQSPYCSSANDNTQMECVPQSPEAELSEENLQLSFLSELSLSSPPLASTPCTSTVNTPIDYSNEGKRETTTTTTKGSAKNVSGRKMGVALFESHMSNGKAMGSDLPKFGEVGWPPPFRQTVTIMRKFLTNNCGISSRWTTSAFRCQKAYFNRILGLQKTGEISTTVSEITKRLESANERKSAVESENEEMTMDISRLRNDLSRSKEDFDIQKIQVNTWVAVIYGKDDWYIGRVENIEVEEDNVKINFLKKRKGQHDNFFGWPQMIDKQLVSTKFIFNPDVDVLPQGRGFVIPKYTTICEEADEYASQYNM
ncbi:hypothetical protein QZH41_017199 [Actinostola sp. cb2023]|nr:hypothetical protein QZH41_017199 [Actinostola sp. cb2023]